MKLKVTIAILVVAAWLLAGCSPQPGGPSNASRMDRVAVADEAGSGGASAVDSALDWSQKYAAAMEKQTELMQANATLKDQNRQLEQQVQTITEQLNQSQRELKDANVMLVELNKELVQWKADVLGFRNEIRRAQEMQLNLLSKMIVLLGGEVPTAPVVEPEPEPEVAATPESDADVENN